MYLYQFDSLPFTRHPPQLGGGDSGSFLVFVPIEKCFVIPAADAPTPAVDIFRLVVDLFFAFVLFSVLVVHLLLRVI